MPGLLFDTSVYISALRQGDVSILNLRRAARASESQTRPLWLSIVVLEELYVGAVDAKARKAFDRLGHAFDQAGRLLIPTRRDWIAGRAGALQTWLEIRLRAGRQSAADQ